MGEGVALPSAMVKNRKIAPSHDPPIQYHFTRFEKNGAAEGTRTPDPIITNDVLYQLSYSGTLLFHGPIMAAPFASFPVTFWS